MSEALMGLPEVCCVTGNAGKWAIFQSTMGDMLNLKQALLETPEIQALDVAEVALFSAKWAAKELGKPVLKTDVGYYVEALRGFPGPFVKWTNMTLTAENVLAMLAGESNRGILIKDALAYAEPDGFSMVTVVERRGTIGEAVYVGETAWKSIFDQIVVEEGETKCFAVMTFEEQIAILKRKHRAKHRELAEKVVARLR